MIFKNLKAPVEKHVEQSKNYPVCFIKEVKSHVKSSEYSEQIWHDIYNTIL